MPRIEDFKVKLKEFKPIKYTPWDSSPTSQADDILSKVVEPLYNKNESSLKNNQPEQQNEFSTGSKQVQKSFKLGSSASSNDVQKEFKTGSKTSSKTGLESNINTESALDADLSLLTGAQKTIFYHLIDSSYTNNGSILVNINTTELSKLLNIPKDTIKTSIRRLQEKFLIKKKISKQGVGGFLRFEISEENKSKCLEIQKNELLNIFKTGFETGSKTGFSPNVVSSSINNTTTYNCLLPIEWENIDYSSLEHFGFGKSHLIQIYREFIKKPDLTLSPDIIQDSINALAFDLKYNNIANSFKNSPTVVLTLLLKKGQPYSSKTPEKFLTPQEEAMQNYLFNKQQKIKAQEEQQNKLREMEFIDWYNNLSEEQINSIVGDKINTLIGSKIMKEKSIKGLLMQYFDAELWPSKKKQIIEEIQNVCNAD